MSDLLDAGKADLRVQDGDGHPAASGMSVGSACHTIPNMSLYPRKTITRQSIGESKNSLQLDVKEDAYDVPRDTGDTCHSW